MGNQIWEKFTYVADNPKRMKSKIAIVLIW